MNSSHAGGFPSSYVLSHGVAQLLLWSGFHYLFPALATQIAEQTGWSVVYLSTSFTLGFLTWALSAPFVGALIDAGRGARVMRCGGIAGVILLLCLSQVADRSVFSCLIILLGMCMASTLYDPCFAVMMRRLEGKGADAVASVTLIAGFATLLTFPLVIGLSDFLTWQQITLVFAALAAAGVAVMPIEPAWAADRRREKSKMPVERGPVLIAVSFGLVMMGHVILLFLLPIALERTEADANVALLALAILGPAQIAGRIAWKAYGAALPLQLCAVAMFACLCVPACVLLVFGVTPMATCAALVIQGACYGVHTIVRPALAQLYLAPADLGRGLGGIAMVGLVMMAVGPTVGGVLWSSAGMAGLLAGVLLLNLLALGLGLALPGAKPKEEAA